MATPRGNSQREAVFARDRGVCALCRLDTERVRRIFDNLHARSQWPRLAILVDRLRAWRRGSVYSIRPYSGDERHDRLKALWHADHIIPLAEDGPDTLENQRTLCLKCHNGESGLLHRRLHQRRKAA